MKKKAVSTQLAAVAVIVALVVASGVTYFVTVSTMKGGTTTITINNTGGQTTTAAPINVALFMPLSGSQSVYGHDIVQAVQFAVNEINSKGGIHSLGGAPINLITVDCTSDATQCTTIVSNTLSSYNISAAVAPGLSFLSLAAEPVFIRDKIPAVTGAISIDILKHNPAGTPWVFMMGPNSTAFGQVTGHFINSLQQTKGITPTIAVVHGDSDYEVSTANQTQISLKQQGFSVVLDEQYPDNFADATSLVQKVINSGATIVYPVSYLNDAELIIKTLHIQGAHAIVVAGGAGYLYPSFYQSLGNYSSYVLSDAQWDNSLWPSSRTQQFNTIYNTLFPQEQDGVNYAGMWALAQAMENAKSANPQQIEHALMAMNLGTGATTWLQGYYGVHFSSSGGNTLAQALMVEWLPGGRLVTVYPSSYATTSAVIP